MAAAAVATVVGAVITASGSIVAAAMQAKDEQATYGDAAIQQTLVMKDQYGNGITTMINVYNSTGSPAILKTQENYHGHVWQYPFEPCFGNGQWAVCLHVKSQGAALGSEGAVVYRVKNVHGKSVDVFIGWTNPWSGTNKVFVQCRDPGHWWRVGSKSHMQHLISRSGNTSESCWNNVGAYASIGQDSTAALRVYIGLPH